ncbi:MAG: helix-turn-helix domain-containing protein, partial [Pseudomonadota bacterium]
MLARDKMPATGSPDGFTTREVAHWLDLKPQQVRHYVRRKLVNPARSSNGRYRFSFQDVVLLRTAKALLNARISPRRANRALLKLRGQLARTAAPRSLASIKIQALGQNVVVRE